MRRTRSEHAPVALVHVPARRRSLPCAAEADVDVLHAKVSKRFLPRDFAVCNKSESILENRRALDYISDSLV